MHFRFGFGRPVTFKKKLYVTTVISIDYLLFVSKSAIIDAAKSLN